MPFIQSGLFQLEQALVVLGWFGMCPLGVFAECLTLCVWGFEAELGKVWEAVRIDGLWASKLWCWACVVL